MKPALPNQNCSIDLSDRDFALISSLAKKLYGLNLEPSKKAMIKSRLSKRLLSVGAPSLSDYCKLIETGNVTERDNFISALSTNVTHFYREKHHFDILEKRVLPGLVERLKCGGRIRIWSSACSSGQEPLSIAGSVLSVIPDANQYDIRILATDVDPQILQRAKERRFKKDECCFPSDEYKNRIFGEIYESQTYFTPIDKVSDLISFKRLNLISNWPFSGKFDAIFCRNVAIYFDQQTQVNLWDRLSNTINENGFLFIGHSERLHGPAQFEFESVGIRHSPSGLPSDIKIA